MREERDDDWSCGDDFRDDDEVYSVAFQAHVQQLPLRPVESKPCCECGVEFTVRERFPKQIRCTYCQVASDF